MAVYVYTGLSVAKGKKVSGIRDADNPKVLRAQLKREGILLTEASEEKRGKKQGRSINFGAFFNRVSVGDRSRLVPGADGSLTIYIQADPPAGNETNWLPTPPQGPFKLYLRLYGPKQGVLAGNWRPPPVQRI
jgi:hypothetical protein